MISNGSIAGFARLAACVLAVAVSADFAGAAPARVLSKVNLRLGPSTNHTVVASIPGGSVVDAENCGGEWCTVHWRGRVGYAVARNLDIGGPGADVAPYPPPTVTAPPPPVVAVPPYVGPGYWGPYWAPGTYYGPRWGWGWRRW
jgi:uncharacterized protein YraI